MIGRKVAAGSIFVLLAVAGASAQGTFRVENPDHPGFHFFAHVPEGSGEPAGRPLVVILRGTGDRAERFLGDWIPFLDRFGWCGISIDSPSARPWGADEKDGVLGAIEVFGASHGYDPERLLLLGFSAGASGAVRYMLSEPDRFAALAANGGGSYSRQAHAAGAERTPVYLQVGQSDGALGRVRKCAEDLEAAGFEVAFDTLPGMGHGYGPEGYRKTMEYLRDQSVRGPAVRRIARARDALGAGRFEEVEPLVDGALEILAGADPSSDEVRQELEALAEEARRLRTGYDAAWKAYLARNARDRRALESLPAIEALVRGGQVEEAARELIRLVDRHGDGLVASRLAARRLDELLSDPEGGQALADRLAGSQVETLFERAERYRGRGRMDQAAPIYARILDEYPHTSFAAEARRILGR